MANRNIGIPGYGVALLDEGGVSALRVDSAGVRGNLHDQGGVEYAVEAYRLGGALSDTAATSSAIAAAYAAGGAVVRLSGRTYTVTAVSLQNLEGITLRGSGWSNMTSGGTKLVFSGASGGTLLNMNGARYCSVEYIGFFANTSVEGTTSTATAVKAIGNPTYNGCFFNTFRNCFFQNFSVGVDLGAATDQVDTFTFEKCWWYYGDNAIGLRINSVNTLSVHLLHCTLGQVVDGSPHTATAVHLGAGSIYMEGCITAANLYGIRMAATPNASVKIVAHHSEEDNYPFYADAFGNGQKARMVSIDGFFSYSSKTALFYLANANVVYDIRNVTSTVSGGVDDIIVPPTASRGASDIVFLQNVVFSGSVKDTAGVAVAVPGYYGLQTVGKWDTRLPEYTRINPSGTAIRNHLSTTAVLDFGSIAAHSSLELTGALTGVDSSNQWTFTVTPVGSLEDGLMPFAWGAGADTFAIRMNNFTAGAINPASRTFRIDAWRH